MNKYYEKISDIEVKIENNNLIYDIPSHFHKATELQLILENPYEINVANETHVVEPGSLLIIPPYMEHEAIAQPNTRTYLLVMPHDYFNYFPSYIHSNEKFFILSDVEFNKQSIQPLLKEFFVLHSQIKELSQKMQSVVYIGWTNLIFGLIFSHYKLHFSSNKKKNSTELSEQLLDYIDKNYANPDLSIKTIASLFGYNSSYLSRLFSKSYKTSISKYINSIRIQNFITLYYNDKHTTFLNLALKCGFSSESTFYRAFLDYTGTTPALYFYECSRTNTTPPPVLFEKGKHFKK